MLLFLLLYLWFNIRGAGVAAKGREVAQGLALLLEAHDGVLLEHGGGGRGGPLSSCTASRTGSTPLARIS